MTDYLEQLLEEQEQEEPGQELEWDRVTLPPRTRQTREQEGITDAQSGQELWEEFAQRNEKPRAGQAMLSRDQEMYDGGRAFGPAPASDEDTEQDVEFGEESDMGLALEMSLGPDSGQESGIPPGWGSQWISNLISRRASGQAAAMAAGRGPERTAGQEAAGQEAGLVLDPVFGRAVVRRAGLDSLLGAAYRLGTELDAEREERLAVDLSVEMAGRNRLDAQPLTVALARLRRAVRQVNAQAGRRSSSGPEPAGERVGAVRMSGSAQNGAMDYAALVDAAFARDARRYDGPLGLL